jgi:hypothetical protein
MRQFIRDLFASIHAARVEFHRRRWMSKRRQQLIDTLPF